MDNQGLASYVTKRLQDWNQAHDDQHHTTTSLSRALGFGSSYIDTIINGQFQPSIKRCRDIANFFGDDPATILRLAGH